MRVTEEKSSMAPFLGHRHGGHGMRPVEPRRLRLRGHLSGTLASHLHAEQLLDIFLEDKRHSDFWHSCIQWFLPSVSDKP